MSKSWRLTRQAEASLVGIALWTFENFGFAAVSRPTKKI